MFLFVSYIKCLIACTGIFFTASKTTAQEAIPPTRGIQTALSPWFTLFFSQSVSPTADSPLLENPYAKSDADLFYLSSCIPSPLPAIPFPSTRQALDNDPFSSALTVRADPPSLMKIRRFQNDEWTSSDKFLHVGVSFALTCLGGFLSERLFQTSPHDSRLLAAGGTFMIGFSKEIRDDLMPSNFFSLKDLIADMFGILAGLLTLHFLGIGLNSRTP